MIKTLATVDATKIVLALSTLCSALSDWITGGVENTAVLLGEFNYNRMSALS